MNIHDSKRLAQLETATAAELPEGVPLDADTEALRESWLGLRHLLSAVEEPPDAAAVERLCRLAPPPTTKHTTRNGRVARRSRPGAAIIALSAVVAATVLAVIVARTASTPSENSFRADVESIAKQQIPAAPAEHVELADEATAAATVEREHEDNGELVAWDHSLDAQLARADQQLETLAHAWRSDELRYYAFEQRVHELQAELSGESL